MKLYADESGHESMRGLELLVCSALARVEVPGALWRKVRLGELGARSAAALTATFESDYSRDPGCEHPLYTTGVTAEVLDGAASLTRSHALRAYDAVQLASAIAVRTHDPDGTRFACFDGELRNAAAAEGFELIPGSL